MLNIDGQNCGDVRVSKCVALLQDDYARQGGNLSFDDATRVMSKRGLGPEEWAAVLQSLSNAGIKIDRPQDNPAEGDSDQGRRRGAKSQKGATDRPSSSFEAAYGSSILLTHEQEIRLGRRVQAARSVLGLGNAPATFNDQRVIEGGAEARHQLVMSNIRLVIHSAKQFTVLTPMPLDDLVQEGILGLIRAVERYEPERGFRFSTYATYWIYQSITRAIEAKGRIIRLPSNILRQMNQLRRKRRRLTLHLNRAPTAQELARDLGVKLAEVNFLLSIQNDAISISGCEDNPDRVPLGRQLKSSLESPPAQVERAELKEIIEKLVLATLSPRSSRVLVLRFGLFGTKRRTLEQIGQKFSITKERVRQIETQTLKRVAQSYRAKLLRPFIENGADGNV
jgi:RNA polymerase sigma factor (sigma-70 family)